MQALLEKAALIIGAVAAATALVMVNSLFVYQFLVTHNSNISLSFNYILINVAELVSFVKKNFAKAYDTIMTYY